MSYSRYFDSRLLKDSLKMINPIVITLIGAIILTTFAIYTYYPPGTNEVPLQINPVKAPSNPTSNPSETIGAGIANAIFFVGVTLLGGLIFIFFIKYGLGKLMEFFLALIFGFSAFLFSEIVLSPVVNFIFIPILNDFILPLLPNYIDIFIVNNFWDTLFPLFCALIGLIYFVGLTFFKNQYLHNTLMIFFGMSMGTVFGIFFEPVSLIVVLTALAMYDIYAVFRGPLKNMFDRLDYGHTPQETSTESTTTDSTQANNTLVPEPYIEQPPTNNQGTTQEYKMRVPRNVKNPQVSNGFTLPVYATPYITIGLGDFAFFSVLISKATFFALKGEFLFLPTVTYGNVIWFMILFPFLGLLTGCYATFVLLQKYEILPALPLPITGGLLGLFLAFLLQFLL